jgi:hypothetical protein
MALRVKDGDTAAGAALLNSAVSKAARMPIGMERRFTRSRVHISSIRHDQTDSSKILGNCLSHE